MMMQIPIKRTMERVPGGMMVVPPAAWRLVQHLPARHAEILRLFHRGPVHRRAADSGRLLCLHGRQHQHQDGALYHQKGRRPAAHQDQHRRSVRHPARPSAGRSADFRGHVRRTVDPGGGGGDERHQWRSLHGLDGAIWRTRRCRRLHRDVGGIRPLSHHGHFGRCRLVGLPLADPGGVDPAIGLRHAGRQSRQGPSGVPGPRRAGDDSLLRLRPGRRPRSAESLDGGACWAWDSASGSSPSPVWPCSSPTV